MINGFIGKFTATVAALGMLAAAGAAAAKDAPSGASSAGDKTASSSQSGTEKNSSSAAVSAKESLDRLIAANLQESANLTAELSELKGNHGATFVWMVMIQEQTYDANMLAIAEHDMGVAPAKIDTTAAPVKGSESELIKATIQSQNDLLKIVEDTKPVAKGRALSTIRNLESAVRRHLGLLVTLSKGYTVTGA